jgi:ABC-2 type transport system ATP-binding protein
MEEVFRQVVREELQRDGKTILLSSHILAEVEALCDRVTIIREGRAVETGTLAEMRHLTRTSIEVSLAGPAAGLESLPGVHGLQRHNGTVRFDVDTAELDAVLRQLTAAGVRSLTSQPPTLEELFLRHYDRGKQTAEVAR